MTNCKNHKKCIENSSKKTESFSFEEVKNFTPIRQKIFNIISKKHRAISAYQIIEELAEEGKKANPPTIYRALEFLSENKIIHKINSQNSYFACFSKNKNDNCFFTICKKCKKVEEMHSDFIYANLEKMAQNRNIIIKNINLELETICESCL